MSVQGWRDRVKEAKTELQVVVDEHAAVAAEIEQRRAVVKKFRSQEKREKAALEQRLQELEREAMALTARSDAAAATKEAAEAQYHDTMQAYERLHDLVKAVRAEEAEVGQRPDLVLTLETESAAWAEEEHELRARLLELETALKSARATQKSSIENLQLQRSALREELAADRKRRQEQGWAPSNTGNACGRQALGQKRPALADLSN